MTRPKPFRKNHQPSRNLWSNLWTNISGQIKAPARRALMMATMVLGGISVACFASGASRKPAVKPPEPRSVWDGVYTEEQAKRGEPLYYRDCSSCHGDKLEGDDDSPALAGADFLSDWDGLTVGKLFDKIRLTMPRDGPSQVSNAEKVDILAYILSMNKFPAGKTELQQGDLLKEIRFAAKPAKSEGRKRSLCGPRSRQG
jgi:mono/diheme cytochrome c family protein